MLIKHREVNNLKVKFVEIINGSRVSLTWSQMKYLNCS